MTGKCFPLPPACHGSCATCRGPTANNCSTCRDPSLVLLEGMCVANCGQRFYVMDGVCRACHEGCEICYPDRLRCLSCASDRVLLDGNCMSECSPGYYANSSHKCREHSHCTQCMNPEENLQPDTSLEKRPIGICLPQCRAQFYSNEGRICKGEQRSVLSQADSEKKRNSNCMNGEV
ncbi:hypothetical protein Chor_001211 [Crotalus horridus]